MAIYFARVILEEFTYFLSSFFTDIDDMPINPYGGEMTAITNQKMRKLTMQAILNGARPFVFAKHQFWLNFSELRNDNVKQPIYMYVFQRCKHCLLNVNTTIGKLK